MIGNAGLGEGSDELAVALQSRKRPGSTDDLPGAGVRWGACERLRLILQREGGIGTAVELLPAGEDASRPGEDRSAVGHDGGTYYSGDNCFTDHWARETGPVSTTALDAPRSPSTDVRDGALPPGAAPASRLWNPRWNDPLHPIHV
jgi:hypothetical protein